MLVGASFGGEATRFILEQLAVWGWGKAQLTNAFIPNHMRRRKEKKQQYWDPCFRPSGHTLEIDNDVLPGLSNG